MARTKRPGNLTERQRHWLRHLEACRRSGLSIRAYAEQAGLSRHTLYSASNQLRRGGVSIDGADSAPRASFAKVECRDRSDRGAKASVWRARLRNGVILEWSAPLDAPGLGSVLERIARLS